MSSVYRFRRKRVKRALSQRSRTVRSRWRALFTLLLFGAAFSFIAVAVAAFVAYRTYAGDLKPPEQAIAEATIGTSIAYARNGEFLYEYIDPLGGLRDPVPLAEISPYLVAATIATEDASFYDNPGVNFRGLLRAVRTNLPQPLGEGFGEGSGGSSITQQLVKNVYLSPEERFDRKVQRKVKETVIALELKRKYDDNQILEWYLNQIPYGNFAFGAEAASQRYFGKSAKELTLAEAAMLAGIPQAPGLYTPVLPENREAAKNRQTEVLDLMIKHLENINEIAQVQSTVGAIRQEEIEAAKEEELHFITPRFEINAPHFVFYIQDQVTKMCQKGLFDPPGNVPCDKVVFQGGLRIATSLDMGLQRIGEQTVEEAIAANEARYGGHDGALVAVRPSTGEILTYVGSRDFFREDIEGQVDIAVSLQSHGSAMKPFTYLTAFEQGWVPSTIIQDAPLFLDAGGGRHQVNNWNYSHLGNITVRKALSESVNVPAVRTLMEVGIDEMRSEAHRLGITDLRRNDCGPTITLGSCEVKLLDMTFAYSVFANNGVMKGQSTVEDLPDGFRELDPVSVLKIEDASGNVIYQYSTPEEREVVNPAHAYMITHILSNQAIQWSRLTIDRPAASKTGTSEEFRDGVVLGYTPDLTAGVWMGNADNKPMAPGTFSSAGSGPMWKRFMQEAHAHLGLPPRPFEKPEGVVTSKCGDREEVFVLNVTPTKPGACRAPRSGPTGPSQTPELTPSVPRFPPRTLPTPTPSPEPAPSPTPAPAPAAPQEPLLYTVEEGDSLTSIAEKFGITLKTLLQANGLTEESVIQPGEVLIIPVSGADDGGREGGAGGDEGVGRGGGSEGGGRGD